MSYRYKKPRQTYVAGKMNKLEFAYAKHLEWLKRGGLIEDYKFERIKFKLAGNTFYTPDFLVVKKEHMEIHEVKGFWEDDARVKIKVAADAFPWFRFVAIKHNASSKSWDYESFNE